MIKIDRFIDKYAFLSNFFPSTIDYDGFRWKTVEHTYQAQKTLCKVAQKGIREAPTPAIAKKLGRTLELREDWEQIKFSVMEELVREKFMNPILRQLLVDTAPAELIEGNYWNDRVWGVCRGEGKNLLGIILMKVRDEIINETK